MIDPVQAFEGLVPTGTKSATPLPTIIPPHPELQHASKGGQTTLWVLTVIMAVSSLIFYVMAYRVPANKRLFHVLTAIITTISFLAYYAMATHDGISIVHMSHIQQKTKKGFPDVYKDVFREVYWARYVDSALTTPLILINLSILAGMNGASLLVTVVADLIMIFNGLFAAFTGHVEGKRSSEGKKWGYFTWALLGYLTIVHQLLWNGRRVVANKSAKAKNFYIAISAYTLIVWLLYPIIWGLADRSRQISVDSEIIAFAVLDILAKPVFGFWLLFTNDTVADVAVSVEGFWAHGTGNEGTIRIGDEEGA